MTYTLLKYKIHGAKFRRSFENRAHADAYAAELIRNGIAVVVMPTKTPVANHTPDPVLRQALAYASRAGAA